MTTSKKIRVLIVDDSLFFQEFIASALSGDPGIEVVGKASDPFEARDKIIALSPDVMTLDVEMPKMNGIEFLRKLMPQYPLPVLVVSSASNTVFDALDAGAVDFVCKTNLSEKKNQQSFISELLVKVKIASIAKVGRHKHQGNLAEKTANHANQYIIAIGASTGGTEATYGILKELGNELPGIVVVQHMPPVFTRLYAERLNNSCKMEVKEAADGDLILPGRVLIAPGDFQMRVVKRGQRLSVTCEKGDKVNGHCPSVDVLFHSISNIAGDNALGIILTGMGSDGAEGLLAMKQKGSATLGQNQESCVVYGMPMVANKIGATKDEYPPEELSRQIIRWYRKKIG